MRSFFNSFLEKEHFLITLVELCIFLCSSPLSHSYETCFISHHSRSSCIAMLKIMKNTSSKTVLMKVECETGHEQHASGEVKLLSALKLVIMIPCTKAFTLPNRHNYPKKTYDNWHGFETSLQC